MKFTILMAAISVIYAISEVQTSPVYEANSKDESLKGQSLHSGGQDPKPDGQEQSSQSSNDQTSTPKVKRTYKRVDSMFNPSLFEGDILMDENQAGNAVSRNAVHSDSRKWPGGVIYYEINSNISPKIKRNVKKAMDSLSEKTCLKFEPRTTQHDYIHILSEFGCWSNWGRIEGEQKISLNNSYCSHLGTVIHELLHAVGFSHEHTRSDRDDYLEIHWDNINEESYKDFRKHEPREERRFTPFDYDSVMLYGPSAFATGDSTNHPTISARKERVVMKEVWDKFPSSSDIKRVNMLYECPQK